MPPITPPQPHPQAGVTDLPPEIWRIVAGQLSHTDLSALSQTNKAIYRAVVTEDLFRHILQLRTGNALPAKPPPSWSALFRRSIAVRHCPNPVDLHIRDHSLRVVACCSDSVIFFSEIRALLFAFPQTWRRNAEELCDDPRHFLRYVVVLPGEKLGVLQSASGMEDNSQQCSTVFNTIDVITGKTVSTVRIPLGNNAVSPTSANSDLLEPKAVLLAGRDGQYLAYVLKEANVLRLALRTNGTLYRDIPLSGEGPPSLVRAFQTYPKVFTVLGVLEVSDGDRPEKRNFVVCPFDREARAVDRFSALRSDTIRNIVQNHEGTITAYLLAHEDDTRTIWRQQEIASPPEQRENANGKNIRSTAVRMPTAAASTGLMSLEDLAISANGRHIMLLPHSDCIRLEARMASRLMRTTFDQDGDLTLVEAFLVPRGGLGTAWTWATLCMDNRILLVCSQRSGLLGCFDLSDGKRLWSCKGLEPFADVALVGEHYVVTVGKSSGTVQAWHFDMFCQRRGPQSCWTIGRCSLFFEGGDSKEPA